MTINRRISDMSSIVDHKTLTGTLIRLVIAITNQDSIAMELTVIRPVNNCSQELLTTNHSVRGKSRLKLMTKLRKGL